MSRDQKHLTLRIPDKIFKIRHTELKPTLELPVLLLIFQEL